MNALNELKEALKSSLKRANELVKLENDSTNITNSDLAEIDLNSNLKHNTKGSRFTHNEKLQFTKVCFFLSNLTILISLFC